MNQLPNNAKTTHISSEYHVTPDGIVWSKTNKPLKQTKNPKGYLLVNLMTPQRRISIGVHTLIARAFVSGYKPGLQVNHIDGDKTNNNASNLEWVTPKQNMQHAIKTLHVLKSKRNGNAKPIKIIDANTNQTIKTFDAIADALRFIYPTKTQTQIHKLSATATKHLKTNKPLNGYILKYI